MITQEQFKKQIEHPVRWGIEDLINCLKSKKFIPHDNGYIRKTKFGDIFVSINEKEQRITFLFFTIKDENIFEIRQVHSLRYLPYRYLNDWISMILVRICQEYIHQELFVFD